MQYFFNFEGFKVAYIVFKKKASLQNALQLDSTEIRYLSTEERPIETGIKSKGIAVVKVISIVMLMPNNNLCCMWRLCYVSHAS